MGKYNPHLPQDLGNEWVPIRNEDLVLDPFANALERGYSFTLPTAAAVNNVRFYINEFPPLFVRNQAYTANIYPRGQEAESGPVQSVIIPCNNGTITGAGAFTSPAGSAVSTVVYNPSGNYFVDWAIGNGNINAASFYFATNSYSQLLNGKRILGISFLSGINVISGSQVDPDTQAVNGGDLTPYLSNDAFTATTINDGFVRYRPLVTNLTPTDTRLLVRTRMGDADVPFGTNGDLTSATPNISQWTYSELQRFEASASNRLCVLFSSTGGAGVGARVFILYMALEVFYCEERRVAFGTRNINGLRIVQARDPFQLGMNQIIVRDPSGTGNPTLPASDYTVTLSEANTGDDFNVAFSPFETAKVNELRQLYEIPSLPGVQVNLPFPLNEEAVGTTLTKESTDLIPQLSLHTSAGVVFTESHGYGRQSVGQVYGTNFVTQDVDDSGQVSQSPYWAVRYYARRFGDTSVPLTIAGITAGPGLFLPGTAGSQASTPDNVALDILGDIDIRVDATLSNSVWFASSSTALLAKYNATGNQRAYRFYIESGLLRFGWSPDGTIVNANSPDTVHVPAAGGRLAVRVTMDVNDGAGNRVIVFYTAPTIAGPWTQLGSTITTAGVTSIANTAANMFVGADGTGATSMLTGTVHSAEVYNGIAGSAVANPNFSTQPIGTTSFTDAAGRVWTINPSATIVGGITSSTCSITPTEFDALDEILDGWKEVNCRFTSPAYMGGSTFPVWRWTASGELRGSRWEVLGAAAYAASGIAQQMPINLQFGQVPAGQQLYSSTYGAPSNGAAVNEEWLPQLGPYVSGAATDQAADVSVIFAQDMPTVTGFTVSTASQAISGIGLSCGISPCGIPTHILYNQLRWGLPVNTGLASDDFNRTVVNGFGTATRGGPYSLTATAAEYAVNGSSGVITPLVASVNTFATLANIGYDADMTVTASMSSATGAIIAGTLVRAHLVARFTDVNNYYAAFIQTAQSTGVTIVALEKNVAGVGTILGTANITRTLDNGNKLNLRFQVQGPYLKVKAWSPYLEEPTGWQLEATDATLTSGVGVGVGGQSRSATGNSIVLDDLIVGPPSFNFGYYELQRMDSITEWKTIMKSTSPATTGFKDFEARVGMSSSYRIRGVDVYSFAGPWSSTASVSTISPGVSGSCLSNAHIMIFTTNERQDGSSNLAYSNAWENEVEEPFSFAEAGFTQLQPMYDRNFFVAFRPTERGGDQFSRDILVQAAAIAPETLADFTSLRDMAWEDVSYICLRDEDSNRWYVNVNVPAGVARNRRRLYLASVQIVEVTDTPSPVDP